jgi:outer membrane biosynthesis protein TonB
MRRLLAPGVVVVALHGLVPPCEAQAGAEAAGLREGRGYTSVVSGYAITAAATHDGLVEVFVTRDTTHLSHRSREPFTVRGFYPVSAVAEWLAGVDTLKQAVTGEIPFARLSRSFLRLSDGDAMGLQATASENNGQRHLSVSVLTCRGAYARNRGADLKEFPALMASLAAAAEDARRVPNADPAPAGDTRVYYEHAVGCAAEPFSSNPPPVYPRVPTAERRRRELLARFVVDTTGLVEPSSIRFMAGEDPRFAAAARTTLSRWRFTKPTRRGRPVRQLSHASIVFEPPLGDSVEPGCAMTGRSGVIVRPLTVGGAASMDAAYLTHVATTFAIWLEPVRLVGARTRFVVHRDGKLTDAILDAAPSDTGRGHNLETMLRNVPFRLDPLPPSYSNDAVALEAVVVTECRSPRTAMFWAQPTTFTPLGDGLIELANLHPNWALIYDTREAPPSRDVVSAESLRSFLDTTSTLLPSENGTFPPALDRWSGSLAEIPILGYRGNTGLILGLGTQGQLHGGVSCGEGNDWLNIRREDLPAFWRIGREALALRGANTRAPGPPTRRVYDESEVACSALPVVGNATISYPTSIAGTARTSREVLVTFTVDTLGTVQAGSVVAFPGSGSTFSAPVRAAVARWRFRPAMRGGRRVRQRVHMAIVVRPPEADAAALASRPLVAPDTASRTIFFRKR